MGFARWTYLVSASDVNLHDQIPVLVFHVLEADITEDTGIVDENIYPAERLDGSLNDGLAILHAVVIGDGLAAGLLNLLDDEIGVLCESYQLSPPDRSVQARANL